MSIDTELLLFICHNFSLANWGWIGLVAAKSQNFPRVEAIGISLFTRDEHQHSHTISSEGPGSEFGNGPFDVFQ